MVTRFRLTSDTTAPGVSPAIQSYTHDQGSRRKLLTSDASALTTSAYTPDAADDLVIGDSHHIQFVSDPMDAGLVFTSGNTLKYAIQGIEPSPGDNMRNQIFVSIVDSAGTTVQATIRSKVVNTAQELNTSLTNKFHTTTLSASYTTAAGDRLVVEFSVQGTPSAGAGVQGHNASLRWGSDGAGGDLPENNTETGTTFNPWIEFVTNITFPSGAITGTIAVTQGADVGAFTGTVANPITGTIGVTQADQIAAFVGTETISGTIGVTQQDQTAAFTGTVANPITGTIGVTQQDQIAVFVGTNAGSDWDCADWNPLDWQTACAPIGTIAVTQQDQTAAFVGSVANAITGTIGVTQANQIAAFAGDTVSDGTLASIQQNQTGVFTGAVANPISGTISVTQADQTGAFSGTVTAQAVTGTIGVTQQHQVGAFLGVSGIPSVTGVIAAAQDAQTAAFAGLTTMAVVGTIGVTQANQTMSASGVVLAAVAGTISVTQQNQTAVFAGSVVNPSEGLIVSVSCSIGGPAVSCTIQPAMIIAGSNVVITSTFENPAGEPADPITVTAVVQAPDGTQTTPTPASIATGEWTTTIPTDQSGFWFYEITGQGDDIDVVCVGSFCVQPSLVLV